MNDRLKKLLQMNTFGNEAEILSMEELAMMLNPMGNTEKVGKLGRSLLNSKLKSGNINPLTGTKLKDIQAKQSIRNRLQEVLEDERIKKSLKRTKDYLGALSPVGGLTQTLKDTSNVETRKQTTLPEQSERLKGSGFFGSEGDKAMETLAELLSNETAEQDSLQTDALERLTGSGMFGKKGQNLPALLKAILTRPRP